MLTEGDRARAASHEELLGRVRALARGIREGSAAAEKARTLARDSVKALLGTGIARILVPSRLGGYGLGFDTWLEVAREIGKADASHSWCASLMVIHAYWLCLFAEEGAKGRMGRRDRHRYRVLDLALRKGHGGKGRVQRFRPLSLRQRHQSQPMGDGWRHGRDRRSTAMDAVSTRAGRIQGG